MIILKILSKDQDMRIEVMMVRVERVVTRTPMLWKDKIVELKRREPQKKHQKIRMKRKLSKNRNQLTVPFG